MKRWIWLLVLIVIVGAAGAGWWVYGRTEPVTAPRTVAVARGDIETTVLATGTIEASSLVTVGAEVSGRIESLAVELGQAVKAGDLIAQIDSLNQENAVRSAQAALANIEAQRTIQEASLTKAQQAFTRAEGLFKQQLVSEADYQTAQLAAQTAEGQLAAIDAQIAQAQVNVEAAQLSLERTRIVAPTDGTIVAVAVQVGQSVNANSQTPTIVKIANLDQMLVKAEISEADVPKVQPGQKVYLTILGEPDNRISATLRAIEPAPQSILSDSTASSGSSATAVYYNGLFDVPNPDHKLRISMTAQVTIVLDAVENVLTVPAAVLGQRTRNGDYLVEVWDAASASSERRPVKIGLNDKVTAEVVSGLREGELVVSKGATSAVPAAASGGGGRRGVGGLLGGGPVGPPPGGGGGPPPGGG